MTELVAINLCFNHVPGFRNLNRYTFLIWIPFLGMRIYFWKYVHVCCPTSTLQNRIGQGQLQMWTEHSTLIFENLKPIEKLEKKLGG